MANKKVDDYEEQVRKEFEATQGGDINSEPKTYQNLGKVNLNDGIDLNSDPDIKRVMNSMDYVDIPLDTLPSGGRYYPENTRLLIRSAHVNEIREYSMIDETNERDIRDKMTYMVSQCAKVYYGNTPGHYKDLAEDDRIVLICKMGELTFTDGSQRIKLNVPENACSTPGCHPQATVYFSTDKLEFKKPSDKLEKYYDSVERCYVIPTKRFGTLRLYIPTIGVTSVVADWITEQQQERKQPDAALIMILPYLIKDWRTFSTRQVNTKMNELAGYSLEKFALITRLVEEISIGVEFEITETCAQCGGELKVPVIFPEGFRSIFVPTISDLGDELL